MKSEANQSHDEVCSLRVTSGWGHLFKSLQTKWLVPNSHVPISTQYVRNGRCSDILWVVPVPTAGESTIAQRLHLTRRTKYATATATQSGRHRRWSQQEEGLIKPQPHPTQLNWKINHLLGPKLYTENQRTFKTNEGFYCKESEWYRKGSMSFEMTQNQIWTSPWHPEPQAPYQENKDKQINGPH